MNRKLNQNPGYNNSFLGLFEGKAAATKAAAAADAAAKVEAAKQQTLLIQTLANQNGYNPDQGAIDTANAGTLSDRTLYIVLGVVVVAVMVGLYFIMKRR